MIVSAELAGPVVTISSEQAPKAEKLVVGLDNQGQILLDSKPATIDQTVKAGANIIVVGAAIYGAPCPATAAKEIRELVDATEV